MERRILVVLVVVGLVFCLAGSAYAMCGMCGTGGGGHEHGKEVSATAKSKAVDVGNKICPVTGDKIDKKTKVQYEYKGKIYNFCCPGCIGPFKKDPKKYIKKVDEELKGTKPAAKRTSHQHSH